MELKAGDEITVFWGKQGKIKAVIHRIGRKGEIHAKRWHSRRDRYTDARQVFLRADGVYDIERRMAIPERAR